MKVCESAWVRNVALLGHGHCGKTSVASAAIFTAGGTDRHLKPDEGATVTDFDEEELARKFSISSAVAAVNWQRYKINFVDTPGLAIFLNDTRSTLIAADSAVVVLDGAAGVEVSTEKVWQFAKDLDLPAALFVNKLDRDRSSFTRVVSQLQERFGRTATPLQLPLFVDKKLAGVIDLITMQAFTYAAGSKGRGVATAIPASEESDATKAHEALVEMIAEGNDELLEEFFATGTLPVEHIVSGLQDAVRERRIFPILCGAAQQNIGMDLLLSFAGEVFPSALQRPGVKGIENGAEVVRPIVENETPAVFVFKTAVDPFAGRLSYFKVMAGTVRDDAHLTNQRTQTQERLAHIAAPFGKTLQPVTELRAGDVGVVAKLKDAATGDTLCTKPKCVVYSAATAPEPSIAFAVSARTRNDEDRLSTAVAKLLEEDCSLRFYRDGQTQEFLLAGNGQQHLEIVVSRLKHRYGVEVELKSPKIPYRETVRASASVQGRHKKQTGGHGQFGDCWIKMEPLPRGEKFQFVNDIFGGAIPRQFVPAVEKGILEAAQHGCLAGYPVTDFKITLYDGSYHDVDSSEMAFKLAGRKAFRAAMQQAKPVLLEPVMRVDVDTPSEFAGDLMSDFNGRRGRVTGIDANGSTQTIRAQVPMAEMLSYSGDLTSRTQGRASFHMEFDHYDYVPPPQAEKIAAAAKAHLRVEEEE